MSNRLCVPSSPDSNEFIHSPKPPIHRCLMVLWTFTILLSLNLWATTTSYARSFEDFKPKLYSSAWTAAAVTVTASASTSTTATTSASTLSLASDLASGSDSISAIDVSPSVPTPDPNLLDSSTIFSFKTKSTRKYILLPALTSFILPGFDQWVTQQVSAGMLYSGYALAGYGVFGWANDKIQNEGISNPETDTEGGLPTDSTHQLRSVASQAAMAAGFFSAYHSFRTYAETSGDARYDYIKNNGDTVEDVLLAPFKFKFLARPTTVLPLLLAGAYLAAGLDGDKGRTATSSDIGFLSATSYHAGVGEEAFFRGFLYPYLTTTTNSNFWGNSLSSLIFGALHISSENPLPIIQTVFGVYDAYLTKRNNWSIQEVAFIHFWWDIIVLTAAYTAAPDSRIHYNKNIINFAF